MPEPTPPTTDPPPDPSPTPNLREQIADVLGSLFSSGKVAVAETPPAAGAAVPDVTEQVRRAVRETHAEQSQKSIVDGLRGDIDALKSAMEKAPVRRRPVERLMKWDNDVE